MKHKIAAIFTSLALVSSFAIAGQSPAQAAGSTSFSALAKITIKAQNDAHASEAGEVCVTVDSLGTHKSSMSKSLPPIDYSGDQGDRWIYMEPFELEMFQNKYLYWDGSIWLEWSSFDENGDESEVQNEDLWNQYHSDHSAMVEEAKKSRNGYICKFSELSRIEIVDQNPSPTYKGKIGDVFFKIDSKFDDVELGYIWNGSKWVANLENTYTLARVAAVKTKTGEYCVYGKNKDVFSSYYSTPPSDYKGVKGDLWIVADKATREAYSTDYWNGKSWIGVSAEEFETLREINDAVQFKARNSATGEVCYAGTVKSTQTFSASMPKSYKGKVNDRWLVMDKKGEKNTIFYYWNGKSWVLN